MTTPILITRFSAATWEKNVQYRKATSNTGCIYGAKDPVAKGVTLDAPCFVLELNLTRKRIEGIGMVRNSAAHVHVYDEEKYNQNVYQGNFRLTRTVINSHFAEWLGILEGRIFGTKGNLVRGNGLTRFPAKLVQDALWGGKNLSVEITRVFKLLFLSPKIEAAVDAVIEAIDEFPEDSDEDVDDIESDSDEDEDEEDEDEDEDEEDEDEDEEDEVVQPQIVVSKKRKISYEPTTLQLVKKHKNV